MAISKMRLPIVIASPARAGGGNLMDGVARESGDSHVGVDQGQLLLGMTPGGWPGQTGGWPGKTSFGPDRLHAQNQP